MIVGIAGILAVVTLLLFFVGLFQNIQSLSFIGGLKDRINVLARTLNALMASQLHTLFSRLAPRASLILLAGVRIDAFVIAFGS